jgi:hypothetical protein
MKTIILLITCLTIFYYTDSPAQFDLGEKIKKKIDKELNKAADDAIDETVETVKKGVQDKNEDANKNKNSDNETEIKTPAKSIRESTLGQASFEGEVVFNVEEEGKQQVIKYYSKDKRYLMNMPEKGGSIIFDSHILKMYVIVHEEKMYMESPMMPMSAGGGGSITKTGETKNILGYDCEKFLFRQKDRSGEAWMTDELGAFMFFMESQQEMPDWQSEVLDAGYFPLHVTEYDKDGNIESIFNVKEVTPMQLSADLFVVPSSYKKLDLMNLGGFDKLFEQ